MKCNKVATHFALLVDLGKYSHIKMGAHPIHTLRVTQNVQLTFTLRSNQIIKGSGARLEYLISTSLSQNPDTSKKIDTKMSLPPHWVSLPLLLLILHLVWLQHLLVSVGC